MRIDCDECVRQHTETCQDCVVTFLLGREADDAVVIDVVEERKLRQLQAAGLVPGLRHERRPTAGRGSTPCVRPRTGTEPG